MAEVQPWQDITRTGLRAVADLAAMWDALVDAVDTGGLAGAVALPEAQRWLEEYAPSLASPVARTDLVPGTYRPDATTTGVLPDVPREPHTVPGNGLWVVDTPGTVIENLDVYGCIKPAASGIVIRNVHVHGRPGLANPAINEHHPLIDMTSSLANDTVIEDCTLVPDPANESPMAYGIKGGGFTTRRVRIARVVDGIQSWRWPCADEASYIHDLTRFDPDPTRSQGDATHNDGWQMQGGSTTSLLGTSIDIAVEPWSPRSLSAVMVTNNYAPHQSIAVHQCWFYGGSIPLNVLGGSSTPAPAFFRMVDCTVGLGQHDYGAGTFWNVTAGAPTRGMWDLSGNVSADGAPLRITG